MKLPWRREREIEEELRAHLRMARQDRIDRGASPEEAERAERAEFGNALLIRETARDMWGWTAFERLTRDLGYAVRQLRRAPGFTAVSILTLALGLGAATAMFSIVNSVLLEPLRYQDPGKLYSVVDIAPTTQRHWLINPRHFHEWREHCESCQGVALALTFSSATLTGEREPERLPALSISYNFFRTLGVQPAIGRDFRPEEELPGRDHEIILSDSLWRNRFLADPQIVGRVLRVNGAPATVVGVMPAGFRLPVGSQWGHNVLNRTASLQPLAFLPLGRDVSTASGDGNYNYISVTRLKPGRSPEQAAAEMQTLVMNFVREFNIGLKPKLFPLKEVVTEGARGSLWLLLGAVGAVLLIVCVNIGNLMLLRTAGRDREAGIRLALGAGRAELFRLILGEALVLVAIGSAAGIALAYAGLRLFLTAAPMDLPRSGDVQMDARALLFALAAALVSVLICGLLPAWKLARTDPQESLRSSSLNATAHKRKLHVRELLVSAEVALSTVLLVIGGLLLLSFVRLTGVPKGFQLAHVITQEVTVSGPQYSEARRRQFVDESLQRLERIPGVNAAGVSSHLPLRGESWICALTDFGPPRKPAQALANFRFVSGGFWDAMGIPLRQGRWLEPRDRGRRVAVISERSAQMLWPNQNPIGKRVGSCDDSDSAQGLEVVGVAGDTRSDLNSQPPPTVYQGYWDTALDTPTFVLRTRTEPAGVLSAVRNAIRQVDSDVPFPSAQTMQQILDESTAARRFEMDLAGVFALASLLLAALGVYGVVSFTVARRTSEIGIRLALGARAREVAAMVVRQGMMPVGIGLAAGIGVALLAGRFIASQLFGVAPNDARTIAAVAGLLVAVATVACLIPARKAMAIDPVTALRSE